MCRYITNWCINNTIYYNIITQNVDTLHNSPPLVTTFYGRFFSTDRIRRVVLDSKAPVCGPMFKWVVTPVTHQVLGRSSKYNCFSEIIRKFYPQMNPPLLRFFSLLFYISRLTQTCLILLDADILTPARPEAIGSPWCLMLAVAPAVAVA